METGDRRDPIEQLTPKELALSWIKHKKEELLAKIRQEQVRRDSDEEKKDSSPFPPIDPGIEYGSSDWSDYHIERQAAEQEDYDERDYIEELEYELSDLEDQETVITEDDDLSTIDIPKLIDDLADKERKRHAGKTHKK